MISRRADELRKEWAKGIRKVVKAPAGSQVVMVGPPVRGASTPSGKIRLTNSPDAVPVIFRRDSERSDAIFVREELADGIFDEINNVIDANRALAKGQKRFLFDANIYYRIYAERKHVKQDSAQGSLLFQAAVTEMYAPSLFWLPHISVADAAVPYSELFLDPRSPQIHALLRIAVLLGDDFCTWLLGKWKKKWTKHPQPPQFFFTFQRMCEQMKTTEYRVVAAKLPVKKPIQCVGEPPILVSDLLKNEENASALLSRACMRVFEGRPEERTIARDFDYLAYGRSVRESSQSLAAAIIATIADREPGDFGDAATA